MKRIHLIAILALAAGLFVSCEPKVELGVHEAKLAASPAAAKINAAGTASFTFTFSFLTPTGVPENLSHYSATIKFEGINGSVSPSSATTDESGTVTVTFTAPDPKSFTGGTVKGTIIKVVGDASTGNTLQQGIQVVATAEVLPLDAEEPGGGSVIEKAEKLRDNTYSIQKRGGDVQVYDLPQRFSSWYVGTSSMDGTKQCVHVECMDEDENDMTQGWLMGEIPQEVANKLTTINQEFYTKYPWAIAKLGTARLGQDKMIDAHMGQGGNVKLDGSSQFYLKEKKTKAYSGQYQYLLVMEFENQVWDEQSESYLPGGEEYTLCVNATLDELKADLSYFRLDNPSNWVVPGKSVTLSANWTPGAKFDWSKVTLKSQTRNYYSGEWFSWDASTQKLTATQSANNEQVSLEFGYAGTDMTAKITLYNGPGYSSFSLSMENSSADYIIAENDPEWGGSDSIWFTVDNWTPEDSSFTGYGIEIDPATENYNKLYYNPYGKYVDFKKGIPEGEFNLIFRSVTDHGVKFTIPVKVVKHKVKSFTIKPHEFYLGYGGAGQVLDVDVKPEDATWNWADLELASNSHIFTYYPGSHILKTSSDAHVLGIQVKFQLKSNNRVYDYVYVDINQGS